MKMNEMFPSNFLKAEDLGGKEHIFTIEAIMRERVGQQKEERSVAYFRGEDRGLILNKTNACAVEKIAGSDDSDDWPGAQVVLYPERVDFQGKKVWAIRVKEPAPAKAVKS